MSGRDKSWDVQVAKAITYIGAVCVGGLAVAWLFAGIVVFTKHHPYITLTFAIIIWFLATVWYLLDKIKVMGRAE